MHVSETSAQFPVAGRLLDINLIPSAISEHLPQYITLHISTKFGIQPVVMQQKRSSQSTGSS